MKPLRTMLSNAGAAFTAAFGALAHATVKYLPLAPYYLSHLLWLISQKFVDLARDGYGGNAAVYACLRLLSQSVPEPPLVAYYREDDGGAGVPLPWNHPARVLVRNPNPFLTEYELMELITLHLGITGRFTAWKERSILGQTIALWPLRPDRVGPIYGDAAAGEPLLIGWSYQIPGTTHYQPIPVQDILNINIPNPSGESGGIVEGLGPMQVLAAEVGVDNEATRFVGNLVSNYAVPGTVLHTKGRLSSPEDAKIIKQAFMADFGGAKRGEPAILDADSTISTVGFSLQQLEFPQVRKISESRVAAAFGVPAILVGLLVGLESGIRATTDELRALFAETTLVNYWQRYQDAFTNQIAPDFGDNIIYEFDLTKVRSLVGHTIVEMERVALAYQNGALTKNEYRQALGFDKRMDGDVYVDGIGSGRGMESEKAAQPLDPTRPGTPDEVGHEDNSQSLRKPDPPAHLHPADHLVVPTP